MSVFERIAEEKIREAMSRGEFDNLPGAGKPLAFEDLEWVPQDQRLAFKILRNAGCIPPELELKKEIQGLKDLIKTLDDEKERLKRLNELNYKLQKFAILMKRPFNLEDFPDYGQKVCEKVMGR